MPAETHASSCDVLFFAEDPGAANFLSPVIDALAVARRVRVVASGLALASLRTCRIRAEYAAGGADQLIGAARPRLVVCGTASNPRSFGLALIDAARAAKIASAAVVDAAINADLRFRGLTGNPLSHAPEWLLVPDDYTAHAFLALGTDAGHLIVTGNPHFERVASIASEWREAERARYRERFGVSRTAATKIILCVSEGSSRTLAAGRTEFVLETLLAAARNVSPPALVALRPHPKDARDDYEKYRDRIDRFDSTESSLEAVFAADVVVGSRSMLLAEAAIVGTPTVSVAPQDEAQSVPSVRSGVTPVASDQLALARLLGAALANHARTKWAVPSATGNVLQFVERVLAA